LDREPVGRDAAETGDVAAGRRVARVETSIGYTTGARRLSSGSRACRGGGTRADHQHPLRVLLRYAASPTAALSWRFRREYAGSGALRRLVSHVVRLVQYVIGPISEVCSLLSTFQRQRPDLPMGQARTVPP